MNSFKKGDVVKVIQVDKWDMLNKVGVGDLFTVLRDTEVDRIVQCKPTCSQYKLSAKGFFPNQLKKVW